MWTFTMAGFFSVVEKREDKAAGTVTVRARVRSDLERLRDLYLPTMAPIAATPKADYQFRAKASREAFALAMAKVAAEVDSSSVKSAVAQAHGGKRAHINGDVWSAASELASIPGEAAPKHARLSIGGILIDGDGRVLLRKPKGELDGFCWTFAKQPLGDGSPEQAALAAVHQKTGELAEIVTRIPGTYEGGYQPVRVLPHTPPWQAARLRFGHDAAGEEAW